MMKQIVGGAIILSLGSPSHQFKVPLVIRSHGRGALTTKSSSLCADITNNDAGEELTPSDTETKILQLAQSHFVGQALLTLIRVGVMDVLHMTEALTVDEIITKIMTPKGEHSTINREALFRSLRLVCTSGVVGETTKEVMEHGVSILCNRYRYALQTTADKSMAPSFYTGWKTTMECMVRVAILC
ncbi:O-methyltransferase [Skeletonema marinoi]|uniref:O-methyltransferase n=1 Tax=Skeletonema marinoi TaxID=267567 RepID=A0AAD8YEG6_9STRA|nr:O-methyltransferase [Skeletonema marinoi]